MIYALTWKCNFCGDERPDAVIGVVTADITPPGYNWPANTMTRGALYCRDRNVCVEAATQWQQKTEREAREEKISIHGNKATKG